MDLTVRDWMVIVGVLLIMAVLLDAWRRVRSERYSRVKLKLVDEEEDSAPEQGIDLTMFKELPNGGARVVQRGDLLKAAGLHRPAAEREQRAAAAEQRAQAPEAAPEGESKPVDDEVELVSGMSGAEPEEPAGNMDWLDGMGVEEPSQPEPQVENAPGKLPREIDPEVFMLNVVSRSRDGFRGEDILHILLACDLRFGDMSFFHRHEFEAGRGAIQFSVANMMQPGVFDIDNIADMNTPGLVFFVTLPGPEDMIKAFDYMLETAQAVSRNLGGDVLDESRSVLTKQTMEHCRQQIRDLERRMLTKAR
jgi:cell division protein ZipA